MQITKCDKCKKKVQIRPGLDVISRGDFLGKAIYSVEFCEKCAEKLGKIIQKFIKTK